MTGPDNPAPVPEQPKPFAQIRKPKFSALVPGAKPPVPPPPPVPRKFRCPYCNEVFTEATGVCPKCHKAMQVPNRFRPDGGRKKKRIREATRDRQSSMKGNLLLLNVLSLNKPSRLLMVLAVLMIVGGALAIGTARIFPGTVSRTRESIAAGEVTALRIALDRFRRDCGRYPTTNEGLVALVQNPGIDDWGGHYVNLVKSDPWRRKYLYRLDDGKVRVFSRGLDGVEGTKDDIVAQDPTREEVYADKFYSVSIGRSGTSTNSIPDAPHP